MNRRDSGLALVVVVTYLAILTVLGSAFFATVNRSIGRVVSQEREEVCRYLAEAGVEKALVMLAADPAYRGETDTPLGPGRFTVSVESAAGGVRTIRALGELTDGSDVIERERLTAVAEFDGGKLVRLSWTEVAHR